MEKVKNYMDRLGEKLFPDLSERKRRRITVQILTGVFVSLVCMAGMGISRHRAVKEIEKYQAIADAYAQIDIILEEGREKKQEEAAEELEAEAERYRQEEETERREKGIEAYDWDALCSANEDIKGWLYIPDSLINFLVTGVCMGKTEGF